MRVPPHMALLAALLLLAGCIADERGHTVRLDKGGYAGPPDTAIGDAARTRLGERVMLQSGGDVGLGQALAPAEAPTGGGGPVQGRMSSQDY